MDIKEIKKLIDLAIKSDLAELEYSEGDKKVRIVRGMSPQIQFPIHPSQLLSGQVSPHQLTAPPVDAEHSGNKTQESSTKEQQYDQITSPMVGTFYRSSAPDAGPYVESGSTVEVDQTVCIIEAMKLMNEIKVEFKCKIIDVLVENGHAVEFGQPLFKVQKL